MRIPMFFRKFARIDSGVNLKSRLKKIAWLGELNARYKSAMVKHRYKQTLALYDDMPSSHSFRQLIVQRGLDRIHQTGCDRPLRIFFLGTDEQQDRSGILQALAKISELSYFTRADGRYGQNDTVAPELRRRNNTQRLWALITELAEQGKSPDILIAQTWACLMEPDIFSRIRQAYGTFIINISMDDRHQYWGEKLNGCWGGTYALIPHIDLALTAAPECVDWYLKEGCPALFFPEASDPQICRPMPELPKIHDICFVGGRYGIREKIVLALRQAGIGVSAFGDGWDNGRIATDAVPKLFAQSKIILGVGTIGHCTDFYALKMRDFDAPMSGSFYLTHNNTDLNLVYDVGKEIVSYNNVQDCIERVRYFLEHDSEREEIAHRGWLRANSEHTWIKRFNALFDTLMKQGNL